MFTIDPGTPRSSSAAPTARQTRNVARTLTSNRKSQSPVAYVVVGPVRFVPAEFTHTRRSPRSSAAATMSATCASSVTSATWARAVPPAAAIAVDRGLDVRGGPGGDEHRRAGLGEGVRAAEPEAPAAARDERHLAGERPPVAGRVAGLGGPHRTTRHYIRMPEGTRLRAAEAHPMPNDDRANAPRAPAGEPAPEGRRLPTSHDVALEAGVSQPTVSRALRGDPRVTEATRRRVLAGGRARSGT